MKICQKDGYFCWLHGYSQFTYQSDPIVIMVSAVLIGLYGFKLGKLLPTRLTLLNKYCSFKKKISGLFFYEEFGIDPPSSACPYHEK